MQSVKRFFKQVFIVVGGIFISLLLFISLGFAFFHLYRIKYSRPTITDNTVLYLELRGKVVERESNTFRQAKTIDLMALQDAMQRAQTDKNIEGIYLRAGALQAGWASLEAIRNALLSFQKAGKFIIAYGENYTQKAYYLACLADEIVLHPEGLFHFNGLSQVVLFYKVLLDKLGIVPQIFRVGQYKSAIEPFMRQDMSQASKYQSSQVLNAIYDYFLDTITVARGLKKASMKAMADALSVVLPYDAWREKLITQIGHFDDVEALIKTKLSVAQDAHINYVSIDKYASYYKTSKTSEKEIAVLMVEGEMVDGVGASGTIGSTDLALSLRTIREDDSIKAVVLRINSPGGSALAADVVWKELMLTKAQKPVVASMSDVAASGGYYLASACDYIFAHPTTITGSIGIFGLYFDVHALLKNKLGITTDTVKTGSSADLLQNSGRPLSSYEKQVIQKVVDKGYNTFLERVATGRQVDKATIECVASGRVWTGQQALKNGLVDALGNLDTAINEAVKLSTIQDQDKYTVSFWPKLKFFWSKPSTIVTQALDSLAVHSSDAKNWRALQANFPILKHSHELASMTGIQARLPYVFAIE